MNLDQSPTQRTPFNNITIANFLTLDYLQHGNEIQQQAFTCLNSISIFSILSNYSPILVGTIPIDINIAGSDLDIILECHPDDHDELIALISAHFNHFPNFRIQKQHFQGEDIVMGHFLAPSRPAEAHPCSPVEGQTVFEIEIFAQARPTVRQNGYRHMVQEALILAAFQLNWPEFQFKAKVMALKQAGIKTEPAFAQLLGLTDDPYQALLEFDVGGFFQEH